jgi:hypothetical protein
MLPFPEGRKPHCLTLFEQQKARINLATEVPPHVVLRNSATLHPGKDPHTGLNVEIAETAPHFSQQNIHKQALSLTLHPNQAWNSACLSDAT